MIGMVVAVLGLTGASLPGEFLDTFTDDSFTQANWTFQSPYQCANPILQPLYGLSFTANGASGNGKLCMNVPTAVPAALGGPQPSYGVAYVTNHTFPGDVAVYAGVTFTAEELNDTRAGTRRVVKAVLIRFDPRPNGSNASLGQFPTCANNDGGEAYFLNMDPASGGVDSPGGNDFSIRRMDNAFNDHDVALQGFVYEADVHYNIYFAAQWDPVAETNHLRAILYLDDIANPLIDTQVDEGTIKPGTLDPANVNNNYVALVVDDQAGKPVSGMCLDINTMAVCQVVSNAFMATDQLLPDLSADADGDGVPDLCDQCPNTLVEVAVDGHGCPFPRIPGDFDRNGDVSWADYLGLVGCFSGPAVLQTDPVCADADFTGDEAVDQSDFGIWQRCYSGTGVIGDPDCAG